MLEALLIELYNTSYLKINSFALGDFLQITYQQFEHIYLQHGE